MGKRAPITPFTGEFSQIVKSLRDSFIPNKGVPICLIEEHPLYYTSTTATTLLALHHVKALNPQLYQEFHETIFLLKDNTVNPIIHVKTAEDAPAWDISEGASVWVTSMAIWALLGTKYTGPRLDEVRAAAIWLVKQQERNSGWGQIPTGIVLHALKLVLASPIQLTSAERGNIRKAITDGLQFIRDTSVREGKLVYWKLQIDGGAKPDPTSTLYAMWALHEQGSDQDKALVEGGIGYLTKSLEGQDVWDFKRIVAEPLTHRSSIHIVSFTPSFVIPLLGMGCKPFDEICLAPIRWLQQNRIEKGWGHKNYGHEGHALSFTTAYALWAITNWHKYACVEFHSQAEIEQATASALRRRVNILLGLCLVLVVILLFLSFKLSVAQILVLVQNFFVGIYNNIGLIGSVITIVVFLGTIFGIGGLVRVFRKAISKMLLSMRKYMRRFLYAEHL